MVATMFAVLDPSWRLPIGVLVIFVAILAVARRIDVRLVLFAAALFLGALAGHVDIIVRKFFNTFSDERFVVPICTAMGFSYVLRFTGCDQDLVRLLARPLVRLRLILLPGTVIVGFLVNMPVVSQASTALAIGPVIIPILRSAHIPATVIGASLLLGCSIGGELFNPGAPELRTTVNESRRAAQAAGLTDLTFDTARCIERLKPLSLLGLFVATAMFWRINRRAASTPPAPSDRPPVELPVNYFRAAVPLIPLAFLAVFAPGVGIIETLASWFPSLGLRQFPTEWLEDSPGQFETRLIGVAMLIGVAAAMAARPHVARYLFEQFFLGAGTGFANIVSVIVAAVCFGKGLELIGIAQLLTDQLATDARVLIVAAGITSLGFAVLCGSGMATTQSLFPFFAASAIELGIDPTHVGAVVSLASAAGRTMSPVAAVNQMCSRLTETDAVELSKRVAVPLLAGVAAIIVAAVLSIPSL
jgi:DcuC family C4-dicarboxylate transporter